MPCTALRWGLPCRALGLWGVAASCTHLAPSVCGGFRKLRQMCLLHYKRRFKAGLIENYLESLRHESKKALVSGSNCGMGIFSWDCLSIDLVLRMDSWSWLGEILFLGFCLCYCLSLFTVNFWLLLSEFYSRVSPKEALLFGICLDLIDEVTSFLSSEHCFAFASVKALLGFLTTDCFTDCQ